VEVNITAAVTTLSLQPGVKSEVFAYNGHVPAPHSTCVKAITSSSISGMIYRADHGPWHGIHLPFESDGSPFRPIKPGETHNMNSPFLRERRAPTGITRIPITARVSR